MNIEQIIFPSKVKKELKYWFEQTKHGFFFMVRCPICGKQYCYSRIKYGDVTDGIEKNESFFMKEWEQNCPNYKHHAN